MTLKTGHAIRQAHAMPRIPERIADPGAGVPGNTPADFGIFVKAEVARRCEVAEASGAKTG